jgi:hypothetical protein
VRRWLLNIVTGVSLLALLYALYVIALIAYHQLEFRWRLASMPGEIHVHTVYNYRQIWGFPVGVLIIGATGAVVPAARFVRWWRTKRPSGCCESCGYDLRASKDRCPECGTAIPPAAEEVP